MDSIDYTIYTQQIAEWRYAIDQSVALSFTSDLLKGNITDFALSNFFQSNSDYVVKLQYFPILIDQFASLTASQSSMTLGKTTINYANKGVIKQTPSIKLLQFRIPEHFNNFLDYEPYTVYYLHVPYFEPMKIPNSFTNNFVRFELYMSVDFNSGYATIYLYANEDADNPKYVLVDSKSTKISIDIALGKSNKEEQERNNILQGISAIGSALGLYLGVSTGNPLITAGSVGLLTKNMTQAISNNVDRLSSYHGGNGNRTSLCVDKRFYIYKERPKNVKYPNATIKGKPCKQNLLLSNVSGYTEIGEIHFNPNNANIMDDEISEIIELMHTGIIL